ncbi:MAG: ATP-binding protein [Variovorax sp.]
MMPSPLSLAGAGSRTAADLGQLLLAMPASCRSMLQGRGIVLEHRLPAHPLPVFVRQEDIEQLLMHLARIACRALKDGGTLRVLALADGARAAVHFMDTGPGALEPGLAHLFERGSRESDAGVLHCQRIASAHNGRIYAAPSALGALGITFRLPLCAPAPAAEVLR